MAIERSAATHNQSLAARCSRQQATRAGLGREFGQCGLHVFGRQGFQARQLWQVRESIPLAQAAEGLNIKHDISLPISQIPAFVAQTSALLEHKIPGVRLVNFGHLGDGNLHFNVQAPAGSDGKAFLLAQEERVNDWVYDAVAQFGGSFSAEHGIGALKVATLQKYQSPVALQMMRAIKQALDPDNLLNPGRVLSVQ